MKARVGGQPLAWHDPHNNGTYSVQSYGGTFSTSRLTGDKKYTDKQIFTLTDASGSCQIEACSRSQVTSILDMGTNYCDLKMLYCGSADGCKPVTNDFTVGGENTEKFSQASIDMGACLKVALKQQPVAASTITPISVEASMPHETVLHKEAMKERSINAAGGPCCKVCSGPQEKYFSVDGEQHSPLHSASYALSCTPLAWFCSQPCMSRPLAYPTRCTPAVPHGFCGETCMDPKNFRIFKIFEANLTKATDHTPCSEQYTPTGGHYLNYSRTVTHGVPGLLSITLDLYAPVGRQAYTV